jgi:transcriptional regulator with XRE-family HTH domain
MPKQARRRPDTPESERTYEIRNRITKRRKVLNLSQDELGQRLGISHVAVSAIEGGATALTIERIESIAAALECTTDYLLGTEHEVGKLLCVPVAAFAVIETYAVAYALALAEGRVSGMWVKPEGQQTFERAMNELRKSKARWYRQQAKPLPPEEQPTTLTHPDIIGSVEMNEQEEPEPDEQPAYAEPAASPA